MRKRVDLPDPLAPTRATRSRSPTDQFALSNTTWLPNARRKLVTVNTRFSF